MNGLTSLSLILIVALSLSACGASDAPADDASGSADEETVFDPMVETIDRAREVEAITDQRKRDMDAQLEAMEGGDDGSD